MMKVLPLLLALLILRILPTRAATLSDPQVDRYNVRVGTQTFSGLYKFSSNTLLVETAQAITNMGSDMIKFYMGHNTSGQSGVTLGANITNLLTLARDEPSYRRVLDMPFRHFVIWEYPFANPDAPFQDGNYTATEQANDYREMYDLTRYLLTNYNNSGKSFFLGHWEGDGYLNVNNWTTNPSPAVVSNMIIWENTRQKAVDDAKSASTYTNVSVFYYAEANRVRDAMFNGTNNNVRMMDSVIPYVTNLDYVSYSSYDAMNLSTSDLYTTLDYMEAHLPTNKLSVISGERIWIGEYGWGGSQTTDQQEPTTRAYIQRLLNYGQKAFPHILFWEMYDNEVGKVYCLIDSNNVKTASWYLHQRFINNARLFTAQFKERNGRLPTDTEFVSLVTPMLNQPIPAPANMTVSNVGAVLLTGSSARISGSLAQGVYGDDQASVWVYWGRQDGGPARGAWEQSQKIGVNTNFNPAIFAAAITNLAPQTNYFFRFYATNASGEAWAPASGQFNTAALNPPDFGFRMKLTFGGYNRSEALANFPALVSFSTNIPAFSYSQFASGTGGDLRFTDASGLVMIPHEIDEWNTNGISSVWVNVPLLSGTNDLIWAYWGNSADPVPPAWTTNGSVWSSTHDLVWHLKESGFPYSDSAQQHPASSGVAPVLTSGIVGHGELFNGTSQYLDAGPVALGNAFTLSAWVKVDPAANSIQTVWDNKPGGFPSNGFALFVNSYQTNDGRLILETGNGTVGASIQTGINAVPFGQWHRVTAVMDRAGGAAQLYVDGVQSAGGSIRTDFANQAGLNLARFTNSNFYFKGALDEARIESGTRSSNWIWASWMTIVSNSALASYSVVNPQPVLSLAASSSGPLLTWPTSAGVFTLYAAPNLLPPVTWLPITNSLLLTNGQWQFPLLQSGLTNNFYRLQSQ